MNITINGTKHESGKITAAMARRAMELNMEALDTAADAEAVKENPDASNANALLAKLYENMGAKANLICRVFGDAFTPEELMDSLTPAELNGVLNAIVSAK